MERVKAKDFQTLNQIDEKISSTFFVMIQKIAERSPQPYLLKIMPVPCKKAMRWELLANATKFLGKEKLILVAFADCRADGSYLYDATNGSGLISNNDREIIINHWSKLMDLLNVRGDWLKLEASETNLAPSE